MLSGQARLLAELGIAFSGQGSLIAELEVPGREQRPSGPLAYLLGLLFQEARAGRFGSGRADEGGHPGLLTVVTSIELQGNSKAGCTGSLAATILGAGSGQVELQTTRPVVAVKLVDHMLVVFGGETEDGTLLNDTHFYDVGNGLDASNTKTRTAVLIAERR